MMIMPHMIQETIAYSCRYCGSINIVKNGTNKCGNQQYQCRDCGAYRGLHPQQPDEHPDREKAISGKLIKPFGPPRPTPVLARRVAKCLTWNAGTTRFVSS